MTPSPVQWVALKGADSPAAKKKTKKKYSPPIKHGDLEESPRSFVDNYLKKQFYTTLEDLQPLTMSRLIVKNLPNGVSNPPGCEL